MSDTENQFIAKAKFYQEMGLWPRLFASRGSGWGEYQCAALYAIMSDTYYIGRCMCRHRLMHRAIGNVTTAFYRGGGEAMSDVGGRRSGLSIGR